MSERDDYVDDVMVDGAELVGPDRSSTGPVLLLAGVAIMTGVALFYAFRSRPAATATAAPMLALPAVTPSWSAPSYTASTQDPTSPLLSTRMTDPPILTGAAVAEAAGVHLAGSFINSGAFGASHFGGRS